MVIHQHWTEIFEKLFLENSVILVAFGDMFDDILVQNKIK